MTTRARSPSPTTSTPAQTRSTCSSPTTLSPAAHAADCPRQPKRQRLESDLPRVLDSTLPYAVGMHLAPMVRIGTLPTRLVSLDAGAQLVWGPEIVDKAIIGATRTVDPNTGVVSFSKHNRTIFECHPLEKPRLIFQLGSADPKLAVEALRVIEHDVAGVGLNCGCPKSFSLQGGMGAALLKDPERLCSILKALVGSTSLPIDAKIRLLPLPEGSSSPASDEPTIPLIDQILATGVKCLTVHCRTQTMRSSEPALHSRLQAITQHHAETSNEIPIVCNGDVTGDGSLVDRERGDSEWGNFDQVCRETGVASVMIARAAESNPTCFDRSGLQDPITVVIPKMLKIAILTKNHFANTKYVLNAINLHHSPTPPTREVNRDIKLRMNKAKTYVDMGDIFGISKPEIERLGTLDSDQARSELEALVPEWTKRARQLV
ncbi:tRNA-dihydrouridine(20) synthase (NAD(+)) [Sporobolomyces koalae]|uniref:tRNA-dihydrouridine(20) synthase (NAD(+)) n=1 Tax=Sporobolomyces koalae TaxID=500713 RepID=UPI00318085BF